MTVDVLVIGTGISGLTYAIHLGEKNPKLSVLLISKSDLNESNTRYAQGGIAVVSNLIAPEKCSLGLSSTLLIWSELIK